MRIRLLVAALLIGLPTTAVAQSDTAQSDTAQSTQKKKAEKKHDPQIYAVAKYDPQRDAKEDLAATVKRAQKEGKHIILEIGGVW